MIFKKIAYLKTRQDQKGCNFGMVGMGYVVQVLNEYEEEIKKRDKLIDGAAIILKLFRHSDTQLGCCLCDNCQNISKWHSEVESECRIQKQKELK